MAADQVVSVESDAKQAIEQAVQFKNALLSQSQAVLQLTDVFSKFNTEGGNYETHVKGIIDGTRDISVVIDRATGAVTGYTQRYRDLNKVLEGTKVALSQATLNLIPTQSDKLTIPKNTFDQLSKNQATEAKAELKKLGEDLASAIDQAIKGGVRSDALEAFFRNGKSKAKNFSDQMKADITNAFDAIKRKQEEITEAAKANYESQALARIAAQQRVFREVEAQRRSAISLQEQKAQEFAERDQAKNLLATQRLLGTQFGATQLTGQANPQEITAFASALDRVRTLIGAGKLNAEQLKTVIDAAFGRTPVDNFSHSMTDALRAINTLITAHKNLGSEAQKAGEAERKALDSLTAAQKKQTDELLRENAAIQAQAALEVSRANRRGALATGPQQALTALGGLPAIPSPGQLNAISAAMQAIQKAIDATAPTVDRFGKTLQAVVDKDVTPAPAKFASLASAIRQLDNALQGAGGPGGGGPGGNRLTISLEGMVRLIEVFIIRRSLILLATQMRDAANAAAELQVKAVLLQNAFSPFSNSVDGTINKIRSLATEFGRASTEVAEGAKRIANSSVTGTDLGQALRLAQTQEISAAEGANVLSTALEAFNLKGSQSAEVAALLDQAMTQGRGSAQEFSSGLASIAPFAARAGISLKEVLAAITTLTNQGNTLGQSISALESIFRKVGAGGADVEKIFKQYGVTTDKTFFATKGFEQGLTILLRTLEDTDGGLRGLRTSTNNIGDAFKEYSQVLAAQSGAQDTFAKKNKEIEESIGKRFQKEIENVKTLFQKDFGDAIIGLSDAFGGLTNAVKIGEQVFAIAGITLLLLKKNIVATIVDTTLLTATNIRAAGSFTFMGGQATFASAGVNTLRTAVSGLAVASGTLLSILSAGAFVGGFALGSFIDKKLNEDKVKDFQDALNKIEDLRKTELENNIRFDVEAASREVEVVKNKFDLLYSLRLEYVAKVRQQIDKILDYEKEKTAETTAALKNSGNEFISTLRSSISSAERAIEESLRNTERIKNDFAKLQFQQKLDAATNPQARQQQILAFDFQGPPPIQQAQQSKNDVILEEIERVNKRAKDLFEEAAKGNVDRANQARQELQEVQNLFKRLEASYTHLNQLQQTGVLAGFQHQIEATRALANEDLKATRLRQQNAIHLQQLTGKQGPEADLSRQRAAFTLAEGLAQIDVQQTAEADKLALAQVRTTAELRRQLAYGFDKNTLLQLEYQQKELLLAQEEALRAKLAREAEEKKAELEKTLGLVRQIEGISLFDKKNQFDPTALDKYRRLVGELKDQLDKAVTADPKQLAADPKQFGQSIIAQEAQLVRQANAVNLGERTTSAEKEIQIDNEKNKFLLENLNDRIAKTIEAEKRAKAKIAAISEVIAPGPSPSFGNIVPGFKQGLTDFNENASPENLKKLLDVVDKAINTLNKSGRNPDLLKNLKDLNDIINLYKGNEGILKDLRESLDSLGKGTDNRIKNIGDSLQGIGGAVPEVDAVSTSFSRLEKHTDNVLQKVNALSEAIKKLPQVPSVVGPPAPDIGERGDGGLINWGAFGRDATLAKVTRGEFVMNPEATQMFYPQLIAMNALRGYAEGGLVGGDTVTVGDINVNMTTSKSDEQTARNLANAIQREIRRGNIRL